MVHRVYSFVSSDLLNDLTVVLLDHDQGDDLGAVSERDSLALHTLHQEQCFLEPELLDPAHGVGLGAFLRHLFEGVAHLSGPLDLTHRDQDLPQVLGNHLEETLLVVTLLLATHLVPVTIENASQSLLALLVKHLKPLLHIRVGLNSKLAIKVNDLKVLRLDLFDEINPFSAFAIATVRNDGVDAFEDFLDVFVDRRWVFTLPDDFQEIFVRQKVESGEDPAFAFKERPQLFLNLLEAAVHFGQ